ARNVGHLDLTLADIVEACEASYMLECVVLRDIARGLSDDDGELSLKVRAQLATVAIPRKFDVVAGTDEGVGRLHKQNGLVRNGREFRVEIDALVDVLDVVQTDGNDLGRC